MSLLFCYYNNFYVQGIKNISLTIILVKTVFCPIKISEPHVRNPMWYRQTFQTSYSLIKQNLSLFSITFSQSRCLAWYAGSIKSEARVVMHATLFSVIRS